MTLCAGLGLLTLAAGCSTTKQTETYLTAAGFKTVMVTSPAQEQKLQSLTPGKIIKVVRKGKTYYVFPDQAHHRIFVGNAEEYQSYQQVVADSKIAGQDRMGAEMELADGDEWSDWGSWEVVTIETD